MVNLKQLWHFVVIVLAFACPSLRAEVVPHLYDVTLPAQTQSQEEWQSLVQQGLSQVLERISSAPTMSQNPQVKQALAHAADYVEQFSYDGNQLLIKYSPELVNQLVQKMGNAVFGERRPKVVLWLAIEDNNQRRLVGVETDPTLQAYLNQIAQKKGIPLILPLMDLEDMSAITVTDVWGQFPNVLQQASLRYGAQTILLGRVMHLRDNPNAWEANWQILEGDSPTWKVEGQSLEEVLGQGIAGMARFMKNANALSQAPKASLLQSKPFLIAVEGIQSSHDFLHVESYLKSLQPVKDVNIHQLLGAVAIFEITMRNDNGRHALEQAVSMDQHLIPSLTRHQEIAGIESSYRWVAIAANTNPSTAQLDAKSQFDTNASSSVIWDETDEE